MSTVTNYELCHEHFRTTSSGNKVFVRCNIRKELKEEIQSKEKTKKFSKNCIKSEVNKVLEEIIAKFE